MAKLTFNYQNKIATLKEGGIIEIPITLQTSQPVTAISLVMRYPNEFINVEEVLSNPKIDFLVGKPFLNEVRIGWFEVNPITDFTFIMKCKIIKDVPIGVGIAFQLYEADEINTLNEIAGADYNPVDGVILDTISYTQKSTVTARKAAQEYNGKPIVSSCSNCAEKSANRCTVGDFVVAAKGLCKLYKPK